MWEYGTENEALISHFMFAKAQRVIFRTGGICYAHRVHSADAFACLGESEDAHEQHLGSLGNWDRLGGLAMGLAPQKERRSILMCLEPERHRV